MKEYPTCERDAIDFPEIFFVEPVAFRRVADQRGIEPPAAEFFLIVVAELIQKLKGDHLR